MVGGRCVWVGDVWLCADDGLGGSGGVGGWVSVGGLMLVGCVGCGCDGGCIESVGGVLDDSIASWEVSEGDDDGGGTSVGKEGIGTE